jgi:hypothetical protein
MTKLGQTLRALLDAFPSTRRLALVGGLAVSARTQPRFTRDIDLAIAVEDDAEAEAIVFELQGHGYSILATVEQSTTHRLATVRLRQYTTSPIVDSRRSPTRWSGAEPKRRLRSSTSEDFHADEI